MNGHVRKKNSRWYYTIELPSVNGTRKRIERAGGKTKKEALSKMYKTIEEFTRTGKVISESDLSVSDYMMYWYDNYVMVNLKYNSQEYYIGLIQNHINRIIGFYPLSSLSPGILQDMLNQLKGEGYSLSQVRNIKAVMAKSLKMAVYPYEFLKSNPAQYVQVPKYDRLKKTEDLKIINIQQFKKMLELFPEEHRYHLPLQIGFHTGLRASEVCGLTWDCIDLINKKLTVDKILLTKPNSVHELGTPKTKSSYRTISISDHLVQLLVAQKNTQDKNRHKYGEYYKDSNFVCTDVDGTPTTTNHFKYMCKLIRTKLNIDFNFHSLRHTHATMLLAAGANIKAIQARLGHSNIQTTLNTYSHINDDLDSQTRSILNSLGT